MPVGFARGIAAGRVDGCWRRSPCLGDERVGTAVDMGPAKGPHPGRIGVSGRWRLPGTVTCSGTLALGPPLRAPR